MSKPIKISNKATHLRALARMKRLSLSAMRGMEKVKSLEKKFKSNSLSAHEIKIYEKAITQMYRDDIAKIEQYKELDAFKRKQIL